jgi:hypothetical protein
MCRYFAYLAYEEGSYGAALKRLGTGFRIAPGGFLADRRNWSALAASASGRLLPARLHRRLERLAGLKR